MRLDKFISQATGLSRKRSARAIREGRVRVGDEIVSDGARHVEDAEPISLDGEALQLASHLYYMLHKPTGYLSARADAAKPTILDLLDHLPPGERVRLRIAGRLDKDSSGLLLLSDDGQWIHRVTSPRHRHEKRYRVRLEEPVTAADVRAFARGLRLRNEQRPTRPANLEPLDANKARVSISEGRYHQVRRMFAARGNQVLALHRESVGDIVLDPDLEPGEVRPLTDTEVESVS